MKTCFKIISPHGKIYVGALRADAIIEKKGREIRGGGVFSSQ